MTSVSKVTTYDATNEIREDLSNIIYDISPVDTPFMSNIGRDTAKNTYFEWQTDALASANTANAAIEGAAAGDADFTDTVRVANYTQISTKVISVSGTDNAVDNAGMRTQMAYQTAKASKELKRDMEAILTSNQAGSAGSTSVARKTAGLPTWLITNSQANGATVSAMSGSGGNGYPDTAWTNLTGPAALTETMLKTAIQNVWAEGGEAKVGQDDLQGEHGSRDRRVEGRRDPRCRPASDQRPDAIGRQFQHLADGGADRGADLDDRALTAGGSSGPDVDG